MTEEKKNLLFIDTWELTVDNTMCFEITRQLQKLASDGVLTSFRKMSTHYPASPEYDITYNK